MSANQKRLESYSDTVLEMEMERRGYVVARGSDYEWERPSQFSRRHGYAPTWFSKRCAMRPAPPAFEADRGATGRVVFLRSNPALEAWAARGKRPGA